MKKVKLIMLSMVVLIGFASCSSDDDNGPKIQKYTATLNQSNNSGVAGVASISVENNKVTVMIEATGMVPNQVHPQHIHGLENNGISTCLPASADTDGIVTIPEGAPFYGSVLLSLENFPTADANGNLTYTKTFMLGEGDVLTPAELGTLENRAIVLHGLNNDGEYVATIPVACGKIVKL